MFDCDVIVDFVYNNGLLYAIIKNLGERPAFGVSVSFDCRITGAGGTKEISALPLFKNIEFLAPHREIGTLVDKCSSYFRRGQPEKITLTVTYTDVAGKQKSGIIRHDIGIYREL